MPSTNFTRLRIVLQNGSQRSGIIGQEGGLQKSAEVLIRHEKLCFGNYRLVQTVSFSTLENLQVLLRPRAVFAARPDSNSVNQRWNISVIGALPRIFSTPSVSGPSFQVCGYHIDRAFSDLNQLSASSKKLSASSKIQNSPMAACGSRAVFGNFRLDNLSTHCGEISFSLNNAGSFCINRNFNHCRKASMSLKEKPNNYLFYGFAIYHTAKRRRDFSPCIDSGLRGLHTSSFTCFSTGTAPDMSFDNTAHEEQLASSAVSSEQKIPAGSTLKLLSGSCYLPHPDKEETGGEDAHFICVDEQAIGVADGVGGWADLGVDAGIFSRELMSNSVSAIQEEPKGSIDPARVLEKAHSSTKAEGSSTACIIALTDQGLHAINLGDSGFMVVRDGCTIFRTPVQQHDFNFTYQLESGNNGDLPSSGQVFTIPVAPGDVIIAGTDGLFDNLYNNEITAVVVHAMRAGLELQVTAQKIAALARQRAQDKDRQTPFSTAAQDAGFRYYGGKLDDITVVVSHITISRNEIQTSV